MYLTFTERSSASYQYVFYLLFGFKIPLAASAYEVTTFSFSPSKVFFEEHGLHSAGALIFPGARSQGGIQF